MSEPTNETAKRAAVAEAIKLLEREFDCFVIMAGMPNSDGISGRILGKMRGSSKVAGKLLEHAIETVMKQTPGGPNG